MRSFAGWLWRDDFSELVCFFLITIFEEVTLMSITVNLYYTGINGNARKFAEEMISSGTVDAIRNEKGNIRYEYFLSVDDPETVLLIDSWTDQRAIDIHHNSPMMKKIIELREKYDLHMRVERFDNSEADVPSSDIGFIRK